MKTATKTNQPAAFANTESTLARAALSLGSEG
jgi:hypothetical protein